MDNNQNLNKMINEKILQSIRKYPCFYDRSDINFFKSSYKNKIYTQIANSINETILEDEDVEVTCNNNNKI